MKRKYFTIFLLVLAIALSPLSVASSSGVFALDSTPVQPTCSISYSQDFNNLEFYLHWSNGHAVFYFDDGSNTDLIYTKGTARILHSYAYNYGGSITYHPWLEIDGPDGKVSCSTTVNIVHQAPAPIHPTCSIVYSQDFNNFKYTVRWSDGAALFHFDDGTSHGLPETSGISSFYHAYDYTEGGTKTYNPWLSIDTVEGTKTCGTTINIIDKAFIPVDPICSIEYDQDFNHLIFYLNSSDGPASFDFGDGSSTPVANGPQTVTHDYTYAENGTVQYTPVLSIEGPNGKKSCSPSAPITITHTPTIPPIPIEPICSIVYTQDFNNLNYRVEWSDGTAVFNFDDGSDHSLTGTQGLETFSHAYAYNEGGSITYNPWLTIQGPEGPVSCSTAVIIVNN